MMTILSDELDELQPATMEKQIRCINYTCRCSNL